MLPETPPPVVVSSPPVANKPFLTETTSSNISNNVNSFNNLSRAGPSNAGVSIKNDILSMINAPANPSSAGSYSVLTGSLPSLEFCNSNLSSSSSSILNHHNSLPLNSQNKLLTENEDFKTANNPVIGELSKKCEAMQVSPVTKQIKKNLLNKSPSKQKPNVQTGKLPDRIPNRDFDLRQMIMSPPKTQPHPQTRRVAREKVKPYMKHHEMLEHKTKPSFKKSRALASVAMLVKKNLQELSGNDCAYKLYKHLHAGNFRVKLEFWLVFDI